MDWSPIVSITGALGVGSFVGQYLIGSAQRRQVRSEVLRTLAQVESARWVGPEEHPNLGESLREFETAALIARVPRKVVVHYKILAQAAFLVSEERYQDEPDPEFGGGLSMDFAEVVRSGAAEVSRLVWSPWIGRFGLSHRLRSQRRALSQIKATNIKQAIENARYVAR